MSTNLSWKNFIDEELKKDYMIKLQKFIKEERKSKIIYPESSRVLQAFKLTDYYQTKVVILGGEPYIYDSGTDGLAFSTSSSQVPAALSKIFFEIRNSVFPEWRNKNVEIFKTNDLTAWAEQGVLLLNTILTSEKGIKQAHKHKGWETFAIEVIKHLNKHPDKIVFMLWGVNAKAYKQYIDERHYVLEAEHPLSRQGFDFCEHFKNANDFILKNYFNKKSTINWHLL